ncbi:hypothetical protein [Amycolatopsis sp. NPDC051061]|uniref:hypothetical protein n=1 Tax=Amycolatopsis sp. NPDC051061 TaxID=3155042 RepID=UPI003432E7B7
MSTTAPRPRRGPREYRGPARSCEQCFTWGVLRSRLCRGCERFAAKYTTALCRTCRRIVPVCDEVCRLCRKQAGLVAGPDNKIAVDLAVAATGHQLFFANMERALHVRRRAALGTPAKDRRATVIAVPALATIPLRSQGLLFDPLGTADG